MNSSHHQHGFVPKRSQQCYKRKSFSTLGTFRLYVSTVMPSNCSYLQCFCEHQPGSKETPGRAVDGHTCICLRKALWQAVNFCTKATTSDQKTASLAKA